MLLPPILQLSSAMLMLLPLMLWMSPMLLLLWSLMLPAHTFTQPDQQLDLAVAADAAFLAAVAHAKVARGELVLARAAVVRARL
jgi:hypothetical protein